MSIAIVSDIHLRAGECREKEFFKSFIAHPVVQNADRIVFLGDIFDLMVGSYPEYIGRYPFFFEYLARIVSEGKAVHYLEGNHDLHLEALFYRFFEGRGIGSGNFHYHKEGFFLHFNGWDMYLSHGDELDGTDKLYPYYRRAVSSSLMRMLTEMIVSYDFIERLGVWASKRSRLRNRRKYSDETMDKVVRERVRRRVENLRSAIPFDVLICGHTHIKDYYRSSKGFLYVNNGYAPSENAFIHIGEEEGVTFSAL